MPTESMNQGVRSSPTVLIAEDEERVALGLAELFKKAEFEVSRASGIDAAVAMVRRERFDVIVLDMRMPEKDNGKAEQDAGLFLARLIRQFCLDGRDSILVIFTAYPSARDCFAAIEAGAYYLPKSVIGKVNMSDELVQECKRLVDAKRRREREAKPTWLRQHYGELVRSFGGKTIAIVDQDTARRNELTGGTAIGDRQVFTAPTPQELREKIISDARFRRAMPLIIDVIERPRGT